MSKHNNRKKGNQPVSAEPPKDQVRCFKCGHTGPKDEVVIVGENGIRISNWHSTPADKYHPEIEPKPVCNECTYTHHQEFLNLFPWWFEHNRHLPSLEKTLVVVAQYRTKPVPVKPDPAPQVETKTAKETKVHALDEIRAKAQVSAPNVTIETEAPASEDHHVTCFFCKCDGMDTDKVKVGNYQIEKFRSTPFDRNHPNDELKPICVKCANEKDAKLRDVFGWWFDRHEHLPTWRQTKEILAKHQQERKQMSANEDTRIAEIVRRFNVKADPEMVCSRCGKHHGMVSLVSEMSFKKRLTLVGWVLIQPKTKQELLDNLCCSDCLSPQEKAFKFQEVINNLGKKDTSRFIRPEYLPKGKATGTYGK